MNFLRNILNSIYSPSFYAQIPSKSLKGALGYFFLLVLLLVVIQTATVAKSLLSDAQTNIQNLVNGVVNQYPDELEITVKNGRASTNVEEPYFIAFPDEVDSKVTDLVVIDTKTPYSASKFSEYKALIWLTNDSMFWKEQNSIQVRSIILSQLGDFTLNKQLLNNLVDQFSPWIKFIGPILFVFAILGFFMLYSLELVYLLLLALVIWLLSTIFKWSLNYSSSYKVGLYAMTLGFLVEILVGVTQIYTHFSGFPFMFTLITLTAVTVNMLHAKKSREQS